MSATLAEESAQPTCNSSRQLKTICKLAEQTAPYIQQQKRSTVHIDCHTKLFADKVILRAFALNAHVMLQIVLPLLCSAIHPPPPALVVLTLNHSEQNACLLQTDSYLEQLTDSVAEAEMSTQTDPFKDRPSMPLFIPAKAGLDATTQIEAGDLFDFDFEVQSWHLPSTCWINIGQVTKTVTKLCSNTCSIHYWPAPGNVSK